jgi:hypothetical protein
VRDDKLILKTQEKWEKTILEIYGFTLGFTKVKTYFHIQFYLDFYILFEIYYQTIF